MKNYYHHLKCVFCCIAILVFKTQFSIAQKDDIFRRLSAEKIKSNIYLHIVKDDVYYLHDVTENDRNSAGFIMPDKDAPLWTSNSNKLRVSIGFFNPYKYNVTFKSEISEDPIAETTEQFFTALIGMLGTVTTGIPSSDLSSAVSSAATMAKGDASTTAVTHALNEDHLKLIRSTSMIEWSLWIQSQQSAVCIAKTDEINAIVENVAILETLFFQTFNANGQTDSFEGHVKAIVNALYQPTEIDELILGLKTSKLLIADLQEEIKAAKSSATKIKDTNSRLPITGTGFCNALALYHQMTFAEYLGATEEKIKKLEAIIIILNDLVKIGDNFCLDNKVLLFNGKQKEIIYNREILIDHDMINTVSLEIKQQEIDHTSSNFLKVKKEFTRSFQITRYRKSWPELSSGVFFAGINYDTYSVGSTTIGSGASVASSIVEKTSTKKRFLAAVFYNQIFDLKLHPIYPFLQIGIGTGKDYPSLLTGGGFRILNKKMQRLSISGGTVFPFLRELDKLKEGDIITGGQAEIDKDIKYRLSDKIGFYIGLAWKLN
ncbi:hypothetical protein [Dyadobacter psychrophilus]|uniref:Uncharacterized protein n=1 Tax=Dyadobacter psychrophilus TaxID=651661 RepID=A0A1T5BXK6_9BACT|nr:hypothetical protein [Dyadobacter psychrophilus]SKB52088.1 hypothetical protein SAMN05660293_00707 [Dyadobacter psychrophilus]